MLELIGRYEYGVKLRLYEIVNDLVERNVLGANRRPGWVHDLADVRTLPPILYPGKIMNAAVNFYSHVNETGTAEEIAAARRARRENRGVPYLFLKPSRGAVIGNGEPIVIPWGRDRTDWEVELATVIGRTAKDVPATRAQDYIFGYMVSLDISDRGGRPPGGNPLQSDWFVGKGHDTFAPMGPWIVPKEFYGDPMQKLRQTLSVGGQQMQEAQAGDMIHSLYELIEYASSIVTLFPGDVLNNGTSGVDRRRRQRRQLHRRIGRQRRDPGHRHGRPLRADRRRLPADRPRPGRVVRRVPGLESAAGTDLHG
jgi:2-keto-4-pentenoate hydratase/2-oxohepta-3-ene-1,7-dioic acid hydratase in catechol pathway